MLVQCEMYEIDGKVLCDVMCEHCGDVAMHQVPRYLITDMVMSTVPVICSDCHGTRCTRCKRFPTPGEDTRNWSTARVCPDCYSKWLDKVVEAMGGAEFAIGE